MFLLLILFKNNRILSESIEKYWELISIGWIIETAWLAVLPGRMDHQVAPFMS